MKEKIFLTIFNDPEFAIVYSVDFGGEIGIHCIDEKNRDSIRLKLENDLRIEFVKKCEYFPNSIILKHNDGRFPTIETVLKYFPRLGATMKKLETSTQENVQNRKRPKHEQFKKLW
jgi:hypothetical protein